MPPHQSAIFFVDDKILLQENCSRHFLPIQEVIDGLNPLIISSHNNKDYFIYNCTTSLTNDGMHTLGYRLCEVKLYLNGLSESEQNRVINALHWVNTHQHAIHCIRCGNELEHSIETAIKECHTCGHTQFPIFSPAVMVLVQKEKKILLARSSYFRPGVYSALAGFIELGESAEDTIHREVYEEVGLKVTDIEYFGSQTWPFPHSFMIAFKAKYLSGEITYNDGEIEEAKWFNLDDLPELPYQSSIAWKLINSLK